MIGAKKILFAGFVSAAMVLSVVVTAGPATVDNKCYCAAMNSSDTNDKQAERGLTVNLDCNEEGEKQCKELCIALANSTKADPEGDTKFCTVFSKDGLVNVHVYSKLCDRPYIFTGIIGLFGTRHRQISLIFFGLMICYFQRSNLAVGLVAMSNPSPSSGTQAIDYSIYERGWLSGIFYLGYLTSGIPAGLFADKYGPVRLISIVGGLLCGLATILVPYAAINWGFEAVCATRVIQGLGQGVFYPSTQAFLSKWAIPQEREMFSWVWSGCQLGTIIMMPLGGLIADGPGGWPSIFYFSGCLAIAWGIICLIFGADSPEQHKSISMQERNYIVNNFPESSLKGQDMKIPVKDIATSVPVWALFICQSCENWGFAILLTLTPSYLAGVYGFDVAKNGFLSALPYLAMFICSYLFSFLGGHLRQVTSVNFNRKFWNSVAMYGTAASFVTLAFFDASAVGALLLLILANALDAGIYSGFLSNHLDLAPNYAGLLLGITNALGNISSIFAPIWVGSVVVDQHSMEEWQMVFLVTAAVKVAGNTIFLIFGSTAVQSWNFYQLQDKSDTVKNESEGTSEVTEYCA